MGRTLDTFTNLIDRKKRELRNFRRALRREDQEIFDELFASARYHAPAGTMSSTTLPIEIILLSMLIEQQKELHRLRERVLEEETEKQS